MIALRRFVAGVLVLASIVGVVMLQRSRPVHSVAAEFAHLGNPTMPFVPKGEFVTSAWFCAGVPIAGPQSGGSAIVANPSEVTLTGRITTFTDADGVDAVATPFDVPARGTMVFDLAQMQPQGTYVSAMVEIYGWGVRRATRRQRVGQRCVALLQLDILVLVLRRRLHRRRKQRGSGHHQPVPVERDRQHS
jgi:hypothetical protein